MSNEIIKSLQGITADSKGSEVGNVISDVVRYHFLELSDILSNLTSGDVVDDILTNLFTGWHFNRAFESLIKDPSYRIFEEHAKDNIEVTTLKGTDAGQCNAYYWNSAVTPDGLYLHQRAIQFNTDEPRDFQHINLTELPESVSCKVYTELFEYYHRLFQGYSGGMLPLKENPPSKIHKDFIDKSEVELDKLAHILFSLKQDNHPRKIHDGEVSYFLGDDPDGDIFMHALVVKNTRNHTEAVMANHREIAQGMYPIADGTKIKYFDNLSFDWQLNYIHDRQQGTLCQIVK